MITCPTGCHRVILNKLLHYVYFTLSERWPPAILYEICSTKDALLMINEDVCVGWCTLFGVSLWAVISGLHPGAAMGASFGCVVFIMFPDPTVGNFFVKLLRKFLLTIGSWGFGYGAAIGVGGSWAMLAGVFGAALGSGILGALNLMVFNNGDLPKWLTGVLARIPGLRRDSE